MNSARTTDTKASLDTVKLMWQLCFIKVNSKDSHSLSLKVNLHQRMRCLDQISVNSTRPECYSPGSRESILSDLTLLLRKSRMIATEKLSFNPILAWSNPEAVIQLQLLSNNFSPKYFKVTSIPSSFVFILLDFPKSFSFVVFVCDRSLNLMESIFNYIKTWHIN